MRKSKSKAIDCTPQWREVLQLLLASVRKDKRRNADSVQAAFTELYCMAHAADMFNETVKIVRERIERLDTIFLKAVPPSRERDCLEAKKQAFKEILNAVEFRMRQNKTLESK